MNMNANESELVSFVQVATQQAHRDKQLIVDRNKALMAKNEMLAAHFLAHSAKKGGVRDVNIALIASGLGSDNLVARENALAHMLELGPRELVQVLELLSANRISRKKYQEVRHWITEYIRAREANVPWWDSMAVNNRKDLKDIYGMLRLRPNERADAVLFKRNYPADSVFQAIAQFPNMTPLEMAGAIQRFKIPLPIVQSAMKDMSYVDKERLLITAMNNATPAQAMFYSKVVDEFGSAAVRQAHKEALEKKSKRDVQTRYKAANVKGLSEEMKATLTDTMEKKMGEGSLKGDVVIICDTSPSMTAAVPRAVYLASYIAREATTVQIVFVNSNAYSIDVTGMTLAQIQAATAGVAIEGGTNYGAAFQYMARKGWNPGAVVIIGDFESWNYGPALEDFMKGNSTLCNLYYLGMNTRKDAKVCETYARSTGSQTYPFEFTWIGDSDPQAMQHIVSTMAVGMPFMEILLTTPLKKITDVISKWNHSKTGD